MSQLIILLGFHDLTNMFDYRISVSTMIAGTAAAVHGHTLAVGGTMHAMSAI